MRHWKQKRGAAASVCALALLIVLAGCGGGQMSADERTNTKAGKINAYSSMLGPDASGKPRTELPANLRRSGAAQPR